MIQAGDPERPKVLIVDDERQVLESLPDLLRRDFRVLATTDVEAALELLSHQDVAVILTDQRMPSLTGAALLRRAAHLSPDTIRMLLTAYSDIEAVIQAINEGHVYRYVTKPWDSARLLELVREATARFDLTAENRRLVRDLGKLDSELASLRAQAATLEQGFQTLEQQNRTLRQVYEDLKSSYWHLEKIQDVLPICLDCGKVKLATATWEPVVDYLRKNSMFLSHGYCPECSERALARFREEAADDPCTS